MTRTGDQRFQNNTLLDQQVSRSPSNCHSTDRSYRSGFPTPPLFTNMSTRENYHGLRRKLVLAFDVGTTYSGISYR